MYEHNPGVWGKPCGMQFQGDEGREQVDCRSTFLSFDAMSVFRLLCSPTHSFHQRIEQ